MWEEGLKIVSVVGKEYRGQLMMWEEEEQEF